MGHITLTDGFGLCPKIVKSISSISSKHANKFTYLIHQLSLHLFVPRHTVTPSNSNICGSWFLAKYFFLSVSCGGGGGGYCFRNVDSWRDPGDSLVIDSSRLLMISPVQTDITLHPSRISFKLKQLSWQTRLNENIQT